MAKKKRSTKSRPAATAEREKRQSYVKQSELPSVSLEEALRIPRAIADNYAMDSTPPLRVAKAMDLEPLGRPFRMMCGAAIAYGLISGGAQAEQITVEDLGKRICRPLEDGDDLAAKRQAVLRPRILREFLEKYNGSPLPRNTIAHNVLIEMGVPEDRSVAALEAILETAGAVGFIEEIKDKKYVDLSGVAIPIDDTNQNSSEADDGQLPAREDRQSAPTPDLSQREVQDKPAASSPSEPADDEHLRKRRVFITHGRNQAFIEPVKKLLRFGELDAVVAVEKQSVSIPVPDKVMNDMRSCGAAIIHVDAEDTLIDKDANEHVVLNPNVLIEIGAAMALYGKRFILLVREGVALPSNLQGLYEVRYSGESLDGNATIRLLEAINDMKTQPLPTG